LDRTEAPRVAKVVEDEQAGVDRIDQPKAGSGRSCAANFQLPRRIANLEKRLCLLHLRLRASGCARGSGT
jgi:hypothetical protein